MRPALVPRAAHVPQVPVMPFIRGLPVSSVMTTVITATTAMTFVSEPLLKQRGLVQLTIVFAA